MAGIEAYGAYVPMWRMKRGVIAEVNGVPSLGGERAVAACDEDSITMAVEACVDCLSGVDRTEVDSIYFATASSPYRQKQGAALIAGALGLRPDVHTVDFGYCTRAGTSALRAAVDAVKAGTAGLVLVVASEHQIGRPGSQQEQLLGDAAAAVLISSDGGLATFETFASVHDPIPGPWQAQDDIFPKTFEGKLDRLASVLTDMPAAVKKVLDTCELTPQQVGLYALGGPDPRSYMDLAKEIGFDPKRQLVDPLISNVGVTGTAHSLLLLVSALEQAEEGSTVLCAGYGEGSDAFLVTVKNTIRQAHTRHRGTRYVGSKRYVPSYGRFAEWQGTRNTGWPPSDQSCSVVAYWRERTWALPFHGMKCADCGTVQYPIAPTCVRCAAAGVHPVVALDTKGTVFSFAKDMLMAHGLQPGDGSTAGTRVIVDLEDKCRVFLEMVDCEESEVGIGMSVERTFRLLHRKGGYRFYSWRVRPVRD